MQTGELQDAERELSKALIESNSDFVVAHFYLAQLYIKKGDNAEAERELKIYLEKPPDNEYAEEARSLLKRLEAGARPVPKP